LQDACATAGGIQALRNFADIREELCPACRRIEDELPAGVVTLRGDFPREHKEEMIHLARHQEATEKKEHPFNRIINIEKSVEGIVITTTDIHLPRRIGEAIQRAFHGQIDDIFDKGGYFVRVNWTRGTPDTPGKEGRHASSFDGFP
jgi:hypothetical protein